MFFEGVMKMTITKPKTAKKPSLKRTTIFLTEEHREALRRMAFVRRTSMANLIREAVLEMLEDEEDIREGMKALEEGDEGSITLEEYEKLRSEGKE
jgi:predicted transcriptional regulator